ncbi:DUF4188 domain-containing protein [Scopulibacillus cellulosilyticus]|uniref:DUF4188 domain-containing protein n=1 Tax=Scopulibacillus cellulosilyticus TaxID=2665665 RepID=A0ABW2PS72_9BACL
MGKTIYPGRFMADPGNEVVVFIIGMRINKWWSVHNWLPVFKAMPPMIRELYMNKDLGFLSVETSVNLRTITMVQYWRSFEDLKAYAKGPKHLTAWGNFYKKVGKTNAVGIYHETYIVQAGNYESIYGNMPEFGLAKAIGHMPVSHRTETAEKRIKT